MCCMWRKPVKRDTIEFSKSIGWSTGSERGVSAFSTAIWDWNSELLHRTSKRKCHSKIKSTNRQSWAIGRVGRIWKQREHTMECAWNKSIRMVGSVWRVPLNLLFAWHSCDLALLWLVFWPLVRVPQLQRELSASHVNTRNSSYIHLVRVFDANFMTVHIWYARSIYGLCAKRCLLPLSIWYLD